MNSPAVHASTLAGVGEVGESCLLNRTLQFDNFHSTGITLACARCERRALGPFQNLRPSRGWGLRTQSRVKCALALSTPRYCPYSYRLTPLLVMMHLFYIDPIPMHSSSAS